MIEDPYTILGVSRTATEKDIHNAYRKLAKTWHPDRNPGDKAAEERFKNISAAYHLLGDPRRRARFDRAEIDASGAERPTRRAYRPDATAEGLRADQGFGDFTAFTDPADLFADLFARHARPAHRRGYDQRSHLTLDFLDAVRGTRRRITLPDGRALRVDIPAGIRDGAVLRLKGKGTPGRGGGAPGDALIEISVRPHPVFARDGDDIVIEMPITLDEAVLGGVIEVPTIDGPVRMTVPKGASSGTVLRLRGKGVRTARHTGDQRVRLAVVLPERIDPALADFMKTWRQTHRYDPRRKLRRAV